MSTVVPYGRPMITTARVVLLGLALGPWSSLAWVSPVCRTVRGGSSCLRLSAHEGSSSRPVQQQQSRREAVGVLGGLMLAPLLLNGKAVRAEEGEAAPADGVPPPPPSKTAFDFRVPFNGEYVDLSKFKGKATVVMNTKSDDPEALNQLPGLTYLNKKYGGTEQLKIWVFPTEQGTFETDDDDIIRIKYYQEYGFGQYPNAVVFDKINVVGKGADPLYRYLCLSLRNPNKMARITLNFEKFLLDSDGRPVRRYPRRFSPYDMEEDVRAVLSGQPLPPPSPAFIKAWRDAYQEADRSEYAFKKNLNWYEPAGTDMRPKPRGA